MKCEKLNETDERIMRKCVAYLKHRRLSNAQVAYIMEISTKAVMQYSIKFGKGYNFDLEDMFN